MSFIASFTSQSLVDFADFVLVVTALIVAVKGGELRKLAQTFSPWSLWPVWFFIVLSGLILNLRILDSQLWINFLEFKWIITLLSIAYLMNKFVMSKTIVKCVALTILSLNIIAIFLYFYNHQPRTAGIFNAVMAFSHNIAPLFCLFTIISITGWKYQHGAERVLISTVAVTSGVLTILSLTRGVWIGSSIALVICLLLWNIKRGALILIVLAVLSSAMVFSSSRMQDRLFSKTYEETSSNDVRKSLWKANLRMVQDHPILGVGHNQNRYHLRKYYDELGYPPEMLISHAHNQYLQVWAGTGTLGLLCYIYFLFSIFKTAWSGYKNASSENKGLMLGLIAALLCFVIGALTEANFNISKNRFLFLLLAGMALGFSQKKTIPDTK